MVSRAPTRHFRGEHLLMVESWSLTVLLAAVTVPRMVVGLAGSRADGSNRGGDGGADGEESGSDRELHFDGFGVITG